MTFSEFKFKLKREGKIGSIAYYTVPKNDTFITTTNYLTLPNVLKVEVTANKHGKKILDFDGGFGGNPDQVDFFFDFELADVFAVKIQMIKYNKMKSDLEAFEQDTKIKKRIPDYSHKYPEYFI